MDNYTIVPSSTEQMLYTQEYLDKLTPMFTVYVIEGVLLMMTNGPIIAAVVRHGELRKRKSYIVVAGLALTDFLNGLAAVSAGIGRLYLIRTGQALTLRGRWDCVWTPWNVLWYWVNPICGLMMATVSLDRLLAVSIPIKYYQFTPRYAYILVGSNFLFVWITSLGGLIMTYLGDNEPRYSSICYTNWSIDPFYLSFQYFVRVGGGFASVFIYIFVYSIITYRRTWVINSIRGRVGPQPPPNSSDRKQTLTEMEKRRMWSEQLRLTATLGISTFFSFFLFVVPYGLEMFEAHTTDLSSLVYMIASVYVINNVNPMLNLFLFTLRHRDMRVSIKCLFTGKRVTSQMLQSR